MKGFKMHNGDVVIDTTINMVKGNDHLRQIVELALGTNQGEWKYDKEEGIDRSVIICKNPDESKIRATIEEELLRIDETFTLVEFELAIVGRTMTVIFRALNNKGEEVGGEYQYAY